MIAIDEEVNRMTEKRPYVRAILLLIACALLPGLVPLLSGSPGPAEAAAATARWWGDFWQRSSSPGRKSYHSVALSIPWFRGYWSLR